MLIVESKVMLIMMMLNGNVATTTREKEHKRKESSSPNNESENTVGSVERAGKHSMREREREMERNNGISDENI